MKLPLMTVLVILLGACSVLPKRAPTTIYEPSRKAATADAGTAMAANWSLLVVRPTASRMLDADTIAVRPAPGAIQVYKDAAWTDPAPDLVQNWLLRSFEDSRKILSVTRPGGGVHGDYQLVTDVRAFESIYASAGQPQAVVEIYAKLIRTRDGAVVAARSFRDSEPASAEAMPAVVDAFSSALQKVSDQVIDWTLASGNRR